MLALLENVEKYFKSSAPMSEEKAYGAITTIFTRISRDFALISSIQGTAKRLSSDIRDRISDVPTRLILEMRGRPRKEEKYRPEILHGGDKRPKRSTGEDIL